ncbi:MAG: hypothetical protein FWE02_05675 [Defluviitaleaceae bacterium]|nr:hypothetical protein [Defluviitaleaceae bacterium]
MKKNKVIIQICVALVAIVGFVFFLTINTDTAFSLIPLAAQQQIENNESFLREFATRRNEVLIFAKEWASEELGLQLEEIYFESNIRGTLIWNTDREIWRVLLKDINNSDIITSANIDRITGEIVEDILRIMPESIIEIHEMNITLVDYTELVLEAASTLYEQHTTLDFHITFEEAGTIMAKAIHEKLNINLDGAKLEMSFFNNFSLEKQTWSASVIIDFENARRRPAEFGESFLIPNYFIQMDAITGEIIAFLPIDV